MDLSLVICNRQQLPRGNYMQNIEGVTKIVTNKIEVEKSYMWLLIKL